MATIAIAYITATIIWSHTKAIVILDIVNFVEFMSGGGVTLPPLTFVPKLNSVKKIKPINVKIDAKMYKILTII
jgi:hypothetical protein